MNVMKTKKSLSMIDVKLGDHLCSIYKNKEEQFSVIIPFFMKGFENNQKCIYIADENLKTEVVSQFEKRGLKVKGLLKSKKLLILSKRDTYLKEGYFDPDKMIDLLKETQKNALKEGFSGIRVTGEMTWVLKNIKGGERLIEYEAKLNDFFPNSNSTAICQYNETKFGPDILIEVIHTHPFVIIYGKVSENRFYYTPTMFLKGEHHLLPADSYTMIRDDILNGE